MVEPQHSETSGRAGTIALFLVAGLLVVLVSWRVVDRFPTFSWGAKANPNRAASQNGRAFTGSSGASAPSAGATPSTPQYFGFGYPGSGAPTTSGPTTSRSAHPSSSRSSAEIDAPPGLGTFPVVTTSPIAVSGLPTPTDTAGQSSASPTDSPTPTPTPSPSDSTATTPPPPVVTVNTPADTMFVSGIQFTAQANVTTVAVTGFRPTNNATYDTNGQFDWGDGTVDSTPAAGTAGAVPAMQATVAAPAIDLSHDYTSSGTYQLTWTSATDPAISWTHTVVVTVAGSISSQPQPSLTISDVVYAPPTTAETDTFTMSEATGTDWTQWSVDYGDDTSVADDNTNRPGAAQATHTYATSGEVATLTIVGPDGQLGTSSVTIS